MFNPIDQQAPFDQKDLTNQDAANEKIYTYLLKDFVLSCW